MKTLAIIAALAGLGIAGGAAFVWSGVYDISATDQHLPPTYWLMEKTMRRSVAQRGAHISVPALGAPEQLAQGLSLYRAQCAQCHGAPGIAPEPFALGMTPLPAPLMQTGREWPPQDIFWVVKYGIKMTGMPAWEFRMTDEDIWSVVALVQYLPQLSAVEYRNTATPKPGPHAEPTTKAHDVNADRGRVALQQYACVACHKITGITGPEARVGPPLSGIASRATLGGVLPNTPDNMVRWIRDPQEFSPRTAMPALGVTERDARDMGAYLARLK